MVEGSPNGAGDGAPAESFGSGLRAQPAQPPPDAEPHPTPKPTKTRPATRARTATFLSMLPPSSLSEVSPTLPMRACECERWLQRGKKRGSWSPVDRTRSTMRKDSSISEGTKRYSRRSLYFWKLESVFESTDSFGGGR